MKIIYKDASIANSKEYVVAHGINDRAVLSQGIDKVFRDAWPKNYTFLRNTFINNNEKLDIGENYWFPMENRLIVNCVIQHNISLEHRPYVRYDAIERCLQNINDQAFKIQNKNIEEGFYSIAMTQFGLRSLPWGNVERLVEKTLTYIQPIVYTG